MMKRIRTRKVDEAGEEDDVTQSFSDPKKIVELEESFLPLTIDDNMSEVLCPGHVHAVS